MPEGHVIHRVAGALTDAFGGRVVAVSSPQGRFADAAALLDQTVLQGSEAVGKHLLVDFDAGQSVWIHLGLIGRLRLGADGPPPQPATLRLRIAAEGQAADLRGPQWCRLITPEERAGVLAASGPDPLRADADPERAWRRVHGSRRAVGGLLMDQAAFAGVGNIYRAEVLFRHAVDPLLPGALLPREVFDSIWVDLVALMAEGLRSGRVDTVDEAHTPEAMDRPAREDRHGGEVYVYRRADQSCLVCGTPVERSVLAGRNLYWCPICQPAGARGTVR